MSGFKDRSRRLAREAYWNEHDRDSYCCPDCERTEEQVNGVFEVHHKNGEPMDNRPENQVALCRLCHNLREDKKPPIQSIKRLREKNKQEEKPESLNGVDPDITDYIHHHIGEDPKRESWVNPAAVYWNQFSSEYDSDVTYAEFIRGLEKQTCATVSTDQDTNHVIVTGIELNDTSGTGRAAECLHEYTGFTTDSSGNTIEVCQDCHETLGAARPSVEKDIISGKKEKPNCAE